MWAEIEVEDYRGRVVRLRFEERTGKWTAVGDSVKLSTAGEMIIIANSASHAPAADSRMALTNAQYALDALAKEKGELTGDRRGKLVAHGEWPWPRGWWPVTEEERKLRESGDIIVA